MEVDCKSKARCSICLSADRTLSIMSSLPTLEMYKLLMSGYDEDIFNNCMVYYSCWECESTLKKIYRFKRQSQLAHQYLISLKHGEKIPRTLSRLLISKQGELKVYSHKKPRREWNVPTMTPDVKYYDITKNNKGQSGIVNAAQCIKKDDEALNDQSWSSQPLKSSFNHEKSRPKIGSVKIKLEEIECYNARPNVASSDTGVLDDRSVSAMGKERNKIYKCKVCNIMFRTRGSYEYHRLSHSSVDPCPKCGQICVNSKLLWTHIKKVHKSGYRQKCENCHRIFFSEDGFTKHMECHRNESVNFCKLCKKFFKSIGSYRKHMRVAAAHKNTDGQSFSCDTCEKVFPNEANFKRHTTVVHGATKEYKCDICNKEYSRQNALAAHKHLKHENMSRPKDKVCHICGHRCKTNQELQCHMIRHTGDGRHICPQCNIVYTRSYSLKLHMKRIHEKKS